MCDRWVSAWGKFPSRVPVPGRTPRRTVPGRWRSPRPWRRRPVPRRCGPGGPGTRPARRCRPQTRPRPFEAVGGPVAQQQPVDLQLAADGVDRPQHAGVVPGDEARAREQEQGRVQVGPAERLGEYPAGGVVAVALDRDPDRRPGGGPAPHRRREAGRLGQAQPAVQRHPAQHLGVDQVPRPAAQLPDPTVRGRPALGGLVDQLDQEPPVVGVGGVPLPVPGPGQVQQLPVDVVLVLVGGGVADPHRPGAAVALQVGKALLLRAAVRPRGRT